MAKILTEWHRKLLEFLRAMHPNPTWRNESWDDNFWTIMTYRYNEDERRLGSTKIYDNNILWSVRFLTIDNERLKIIYDYCTHNNLKVEIKTISRNRDIETYWSFSPIVRLRNRVKI